MPPAEIPPPQGGNPPGNAPRASEGPPQVQPEAFGPNKQEAENPMEGGAGGEPNLNQPADTTNTGIAQDAGNPPADLAPGFIKAGMEQAPMMTSQGPSAGGVTTDLSTAKFPDVDEERQVSPQQQDAARTPASVQTGGPMEALQPAEDVQPRHWHEVHLGRAPEALQASVNPEKTSAQFSPATKVSATALGDRVPTQEATGDEGGQQAAQADQGEGSTEDAQAPQSEEKPMSEQEQQDPNLQALETLPDDELRALAKQHGVKVSPTWRRDTVLRKLNEAGVRGPQPPDTGEDQGQQQNQDRPGQ
jgi:hypothetical protein